MCCFEHSYSGIFQDRVNRRACFISAGVFEVLDKFFYSGIAAIEFSYVSRYVSDILQYKFYIFYRPIIKIYLSPRIATIIILLILYLLLAVLQIVLKISKLLCLHLILTTFMKVVLVLLLLTLLSMTEVESATGLVSLTLITVVIIKIFSIAIAYSDLVDMSGDWSYLIEFGFGVILIAIVVGIELLVIMRTLTTVTIVAAVFGTFLSSISLMDLHQNMSVNSWWWEKKLINGCIYHVSRQYTPLWCLRIEEKPRMITIFDSAPQEQEFDMTVLNSQ